MLNQVGRKLTSCAWAIFPLGAASIASFLVAWVPSTFITTDSYTELMNWVKIMFFQVFSAIKVINEMLMLTTLLDFKDQPKLSKLYPLNTLEFNNRSHHLATWLIICDLRRLCSLFFSVLWTSLRFCLRSLVNECFILCIEKKNGVI